jgi:hypothetical protein
MRGMFTIRHGKEDIYLKIYLLVFFYPFGGIGEFPGGFLYLIGKAKKKSMRDRITMCRLYRLRQYRFSTVILGAHGQGPPNVPIAQAKQAWPEPDFIPRAWLLFWLFSFLEISFFYLFGFFKFERYIHIYIHIQFLYFHCFGAKKVPIDRWMCK